MDSAASANSADGSDSSACSTRSPSDSKGTTLVESEPAVRTSAVHPESTNQDKAGVDPETPDQDPTATGPASPTKHQAGASADGPIQDQSGAGPPSMASDQGDTDVGSREQGEVGEEDVVDELADDDDDDDEEEDDGGYIFPGALLDSKCAHGLTESRGTYAHHDKVVGVIDNDAVPYSREEQVVDCRHGSDELELELGYIASASNLAACSLSSDGSDELDLELGDICPASNLAACCLSSDDSNELELELGDIAPACNLAARRLSSDDSDEMPADELVVDAASMLNTNETDLESSCDDDDDEGDDYIFPDALLDSKCARGLKESRGVTHGSAGDTPALECSDECMDGGADSSLKTPAEDDGNTSVPPSAGPLPQADSMALGDNLGVSIGVEELAQQGGEPPYLDPPVDLVAAHTELSGDSILDGAQLPGVGEDTPADEPPPQGPVASLSPDAEAGSYPSADCGENQAPSDASSSPSDSSSSPSDASASPADLNSRRDDAEDGSGAVDGGDIAPEEGSSGVTAGVAASAGEAAGSHAGNTAEAAATSAAGASVEAGTSAKDADTGSAQGAIAASAKDADTACAQDAGAASDQDAGTSSAEGAGTAADGAPAEATAEADSRAGDATAVIGHRGDDDDSGDNDDRILLGVLPDSNFVRGLTESRGRSEPGSQASDSDAPLARRSSSDRFRAKVLLASEAAGDGEVSPPTTIKSAGSLRSSDASAVGAGPLHCPEKQGVRSDSAPAASKKATVHGGSLPSSNPSISTPSLQAKAAAPSPKTPSPSPKEPHPGSTQVVSTAALESFMRPTSSSNMKVISEPPSSTKKSGLTGTLRRTASETSTPSKPARMRRTSSGGSAPAPSSASSRNLNSTSPAPHTTASSPKSSSSALADGDLGGQLPPVLYPQAASEHARLKLGGNPGMLGTIMEGSHELTSSSSQPSTSQGPTPSTTSAPSNATFCTPSETARKRTLSIKEQVARMALDRRFFHLGRQLGTGSFATVYLAGVVLPEGVSATEALRPSQDCGNGGDEPKPPALAPGPLDLDNSAVDTPTAAATSLTLDLLHSLKSNKQLVVKKLDRLQGSSNVDVMNEISVMQQAGSHPNLVHFKGWYRDEAGVLCLALTYCEGGTLAALLKGKPGDVAWEDPNAHFPEEVVMCWFVQLLMALHHLHQRHIIHRDLKPENIFLSRNHKVIKLGDLGIAKQLDGALDLAITCLGTPFYMSPEVIAARPYTTASDIWSLGCILYEMGARKQAFEAQGYPQLMFKILRVDYPSLPAVFSRSMQSLVNAMLRADPGDRPAAQELLQMPLIRKHLQQLLGVGFPRGVSVSITVSDATSAIQILETGLHGGQQYGGSTEHRSGTLPDGTLTRNRTSGTTRRRKAKPNNADTGMASGKLPVSSRPRESSGRRSKTDPSTASEATPHQGRQAVRRARRGTMGRSNLDKPREKTKEKTEDSKPSSTPAGGKISSASAAAPSGVDHTEPLSAAAPPKKVKKKKKSSARSNSTVLSGVSSSMSAPPPAAALNVQLVRAPVTKAKEWDRSIKYEHKLQQQAETRLRAREYEQRIAREQVRQWRKERDPEYLAREAELEQLQQLMLAQRRSVQSSKSQVHGFGDALPTESMGPSGMGAAVLPGLEEDEAFDFEALERSLVDAYNSLERALLAEDLKNLSTFGRSMMEDQLADALRDATSGENEEAPGEASQAILDLKNLSTFRRSMMEDQLAGALRDATSGEIEEALEEASANKNAHMPSSDMDNGSVLPGPSEEEADQPAASFALNEPVQSSDEGSGFALPGPAEEEAGQSDGPGTDPDRVNSGVWATVSLEGADIEGERGQDLMKTSRAATPQTVDQLTADVVSACLASGSGSGYPDLSEAEPSSETEPAAQPGLASRPVSQLSAKTSLRSVIQAPEDADVQGVKQAALEEASNGQALNNAEAHDVAAAAGTSGDLKAGGGETAAAVVNVRPILDTEVVAVAGSSVPGVDAGGSAPVAVAGGDFTPAVATKSGGGEDLGMCTWRNAMSSLEDESTLRPSSSSGFRSDIRSRSTDKTDSSFQGCGPQKQMICEAPLSPPGTAAGTGADAGAGGSGSGDVSTTAAAAMSKAAGAGGSGSGDDSTTAAAAMSKAAGAGGSGDDSTSSAAAMSKAAVSDDEAAAPGAGAIGDAQEENADADAAAADGADADVDAADADADGAADADADANASAHATNASADGDDDGGADADAAASANADGADANVDAVASAHATNASADGDDDDTSSPGVKRTSDAYEIPQAENSNCDAGGCYSEVVAVARISAPFAYAGGSGDATKADTNASDADAGSGDDSISAVAAKSDRPSSADLPPLPRSHAHVQRRATGSPTRPKTSAMPSALCQSLTHLEGKLESVWQEADESKRRSVLQQIWEITLQDGGRPSCSGDINADMDDEPVDAHVAPTQAAALSHPTSRALSRHPTVGPSTKTRPLSSCKKKSPEDLQGAGGACEEITSAVSSPAKGGSGHPEGSQSRPGSVVEDAEGGLRPDQQHGEADVGDEEEEEGEEIELESGGEDGREGDSNSEEWESEFESEEESEEGGSDDQDGGTEEGSEEEEVSSEGEEVSEESNDGDADDAEAGSGDEECSSSSSSEASEEEDGCRNAAWALLSGNVNPEAHKPTVTPSGMFLPSAHDFVNPPGAIFKRLQVTPPPATPTATPPLTRTVLGGGRSRSEGQDAGEWNLATHQFRPTDLMHERVCTSGGGRSRPEGPDANEQNMATHQGRPSDLMHERVITPGGGSETLKTVLSSNCLVSKAKRISTLDEAEDLLHKRLSGGSNASLEHDLLEGGRGLSPRKLLAPMTRLSSGRLDSLASHGHTAPSLQIGLLNPLPGGISGQFPLSPHRPQPPSVLSLAPLPRSSSTRASMLVPSNPLGVGSQSPVVVARAASWQRPTSADAVASACEVLAANRSQPHIPTPPAPLGALVSHCHSHSLPGVQFRGRKLSASSQSHLGGALPTDEGDELLFPGRKLSAPSHSQLGRASSTDEGVGLWFPGRKLSAPSHSHLGGALPADEGGELMHWGLPVAEGGDRAATSPRRRSSDTRSSAVGLQSRRHQSAAGFDEPGDHLPPLMHSSSRHALPPLRHDAQANVSTVDPLLGMNAEGRGHGQKAEGSLAKAEGSITKAKSSIARSEVLLERRGSGVLLERKSSKPEPPLGSGDKSTGGTDMLAAGGGGGMGGATPGAGGGVGRGGATSGAGVGMGGGTPSRGRGVSSSSPACQLPLPDERVESGGAYEQAEPAPANAASMMKLMKQVAALKKARTLRRGGK